MSVKTLQIQAVEEWNDVAQHVIEQLHAPMILALSGPLGAGKTTFVQVLAKALGVKEQPRSPTFSLLRAYTLPKEHRGIKRLVHIDAYRLETAADVYALDLEGELAEPGTIIALEWPEQLGDALEKLGVNMLKLEIRPTTDGIRTVHIHPKQS